MNYSVIEKNNQKYILCASAETPISKEQDALDLIGIGFGHEINRLLILREALAEEFFDLKTGLAGNILQKLINYQIKTALVITDSQKIKGRFKEFLAEANKGNSFRVFDNREAAEKWLID